MTTTAKAIPWIFKVAQFQPGSSSQVSNLLVSWTPNNYNSNRQTKTGVLEPSPATQPHYHLSSADYEIGYTGNENLLLFYLCSQATLFT